MLVSAIASFGSLCRWGGVGGLVLIIVGYPVLGLVDVGLSFDNLIQFLPFIFTWNWALLSLILAETCHFRGKLFIKIKVFRNSGIIPGVFMI